MSALTHKNAKAEIIEQISKYLSGLKPKAKFRPCIYCGEPFKLVRKNRFYCNNKCARKAHYLHFSIRKLF